jgi:2-polyprenyl-3-methyl-5-hydroxy-6-metoxy-1,4-benzoquinol methylase
MHSAVNRAFSAQSIHYDSDDQSNHVIADLRKQVYDHVARYIQPGSRMLELNAGTGIDATYFVSQGHSVLATDLSDGMVNEMKKKQLSVKQLSYENLDQLNGEKFDYVFSNFGGLNCVDDLSKVTRHLNELVKPGGYVTWVIMPKICPWEFATILRGNKNAFRRLKKDGVMAHIDGEYFKTWYHSLNDIKNAFGKEFSFIESEGLAALSPPPHKTDFFAYSLSRKIDRLFNRMLPFNRWADHLIVTHRYNFKY